MPDFLGWTRPLPDLAADWLTSELGDAFMRTWCVVPGGRAGRLLIDALVDCAAGVVCPPDVMTPGQLVDRLVHDAGIASRHDRTAALRHALREGDAEDVHAIVGHLPDAGDEVAWHRLAARLDALVEELGGADLDPSDVPERARAVEHFSDGERFAAIGRVVARARTQLSAEGLVDPVLARRKALRDDARTDAAPETIVLIGVSQLAAVQRSAIDRWRRCGSRIAALVHAPEELADRFDGLGCVDPAAWCAAPLPLPESSIRVADAPADQAQAVLRAIAETGDTYDTAEVTIGAADPRLVGDLERAVNWAGLNAHAAAGTPVWRTAPGRLLAALSRWLVSPGASTLAELVRHPDFVRPAPPAEDDAERGPFDVLDKLDRLREAHLTEELPDEPWVGMQRGRINALLEPLPSGTAPFGAFVAPLLRVLDSCCGQSERGAAAINAIQGALEAYAETPTALQPVLATRDAIAMARELVSDAIVPDPAVSDEIDIVGWLELAFEPSPCVAVAGLNEGAVPARPDDPFLPAPLRRALELPDDEDRFARDAHLLSALVASRPHVALISGRLSHMREPILPSRLLLSDEPETIAARLRRMLDRSARQFDPVGLRPGEKVRFNVPPIPEESPTPESISVTGFFGYINCPYRFALSRVLRLKERDDSLRELDNRLFGSLVHDVLDVFAGSDLKDSTDASAITSLLKSELSAKVRNDHGSRPLPAVLVQQDRAMRRLEWFAEKQAALASEGWRIIEHEVDLPESATIDVDGTPMRITGRIDRVDRHEVSGRIRVIDYKTGSAAKSPYATHHGTKALPPLEEAEWLDLQLPLYVHFRPEKAVEAAYFVLPKDLKTEAVLVAEWSGDYIKAAVEKAREVIRGIRARQFDVNRDATFQGDYKGICQVGVYGGPHLEGDQ